MQQRTKKRCFSPTGCLLAGPGRDGHQLKDSSVLSSVTIVYCTREKKKKKESSDLQNFSELT